eukprot:TRINITY_DN8916_c0_g1_i4.p2 TRINITY_DN8916_c0_g1~~TRINITY_DN8916_c0_g1_i4.p2  ORF type:complete len:156 (-),score=35.77 TRINITY_DN8916_c0_g1_i4:62-529(-)
MAGKTTVLLTNEFLETKALIDSAKDPECGAVSVFLGTTRDNFDGKKVVRLEYEAYEAMAIRQIHKICERIRERWSVRHIIVAHRLGNVPVCEESVVIVISSAHRKESLEAVEYAIDTIKAIATIWKKEVYESDAPQWKQNAEWNPSALLHSGRAN